MGLGTSKPEQEPKMTKEQCKTEYNLIEKEQQAPVPEKQDKPATESQGGGKKRRPKKAKKAKKSKKNNKKSRKTRRR